MEKKKLYPIGTKQAVELFIKDEKGDNSLILDPVVLNPFLRCLEALKESVIVELFYDDKGHYPLYLINKK